MDAPDPANVTIGGYEDINMKIKIYVLSTVLADENGPAMPAVFADEAEARAKYDEVIRAEWDNLMDAYDGPYPGDPDAAQERIRRAHGAEWSRWGLTRHDVEISATK
jgi:hypothetical protein